jgi:pimeloyl-ACP methyl ester carboxylesterase
VNTAAGLAVDDIGSRDDRPPLVLLHGLTFDRSMWRPAVAELELIDGDAARALSTLAGIPDDTPAQSLGRDLRARVEFARGRAMLATRSAGAADRLATAQRLMTEISKELPADIRQRFEARGEVRAMLAGDERSGSPAH